MINRSDTEWVRLIKQQEPQVLQDLWERLFTWGWHLARRYGASEEIKDVGRDAAVAAFTRICQHGVTQFSFRCPFEGYCRRILVNELNRRLQKLQPVSAPLPDDDDAQSPVVAFSEPTVDPADRLYPCLEQLKTEERLIIQRFYLQGLRPELISEELNKSRNNINQIAYRARTKLRTCLELQGYHSMEDVLHL